MPASEIKVFKYKKNIKNANQFHNQEKAVGWANRKGIDMIFSWGLDSGKGQQYSS